MLMPRKKITADELQALLEREFRNSAAADLCLKCRVPKPVFLASASGGSNWRVAAMDECGTLCHTLFQDVVAKASEQYELKG
jgi:hypothetical protein